MAETTLGNIQKQLTAAQLIRGKMRLSIVQSLTGLTIRPLRTMWKEIHNEGPSNGKLPESVLSYMINQAMAAGISTFTSLHLRQHSPKDQITADGLLSTWDTYQRLCGPMDINAGYYALRDVRADFVSFPRCTCCDAHFIYDPGSTLTSRCPFCGHSPAKDAK